MSAYQNFEIMYRIDRSDHISFLSPEWTTFAANNGGMDLTPDNVIGRPFLSFIADESTQHLFTVIFNRVRDIRRSVVLPFRCDSPTLRRFMECTITPLDHHALEFRCRTIKEEPRDRSPFFEKIPTGEQLLRMCSWCKKVELVSEGWVEVEEAARKLQLFEHHPSPKITHGICASCEQQVRAQFQFTPPKV